MKGPSSAFSLGKFTTALKGSLYLFTVPSDRAKNFTALIPERINLTFFVKFPKQVIRLTSLQHSNWQLRRKKEKTFSLSLLLEI